MVGHVALTARLLPALAPSEGPQAVDSSARRRTAADAAVREPEPIGPAGVRSLGAGYGSSNDFVPGAGTHHGFG